MDQKVYNGSGVLEIRAPYYNAINDTRVFFEQEKIAVFVNALGHIEFCDEQDRSLGFVDVPVSDDPSEYAHSAQYGTVRCLLEGREITVFLPVYSWSDSYPDCDGESDRWSRYTSRWFRVVFDCEKKTISILDQEQ